MQGFPPWPPAIGRLVIGDLGRWCSVTPQTLVAPRHAESQIFLL
jgi:hypothetical protein